MNPDLALVSSIDNVIMGPPPSRTPLIMSSELSLHFSTSDFYVQELQCQLCASQEDLAEAHNVIDQQESMLQARAAQLKKLQCRLDEERRAHFTWIEDLEKSHSSRGSRESRQRD